MPNPHHPQKPNSNAPVLVAVMTSTLGVLDVNKSVFSQPATEVIINNPLGAVAYDPAGPIFRIDQPTNPSLQFPPSPFLVNLPPKTHTQAPIADDLRIVEPVDFRDISEGAPYHTDAIFSATISYAPDHVLDSDPTVSAPAYVIELS